MHRLVKKGKLERLARGIYYYPVEDPVLGKVYPFLDSIAKAIAKRDKARIIPAGEYALYRLGLSEQMPLNVVYLTDGSPRKIPINGRYIMFKKTGPKYLAVKNPTASLIIQALRALKKENVRPEHLKKIEDVLRRADDAPQIHKEMQHAPQWIRKIVEEISIKLRKIGTKE